VNILLLDQVDLLLIHALQVSPRASWRELGATLRLDPVTLSRRWRKLSAEGVAWTTCYPNLRLSSFAFVEVDCASGARESIISELSKDAATYSIDCTTGRRDLFLSVIMDTLVEIDDYVENRISALPSVNGTRTHHVRKMFAEGAGWRIGVLSNKQSQRLRSRVNEVDPQSAKTLSALEKNLIIRLGADGRRSASSVASELGISVSAVTRGISRILFTGRATLRCDFAHELSPWKAMSVMWLSIPQDQIHGAALTMAKLPQVRVICSLASEANVMLQLWMRSLDELDTVEQALSVACPQARVLDRWIVPRIAKRMGHVLGRDGLRSGYVPLPMKGEG